MTGFWGPPRLRAGQQWASLPWSPRLQWLLSGGSLVGDAVSESRRPQQSPRPW
jgi:hypothetical protein